MNEFEIKQKLQYLDQVLKQAQQQLLQLTNNPQAYQKVQYDIRNIQTERSNLINALNGMYQQQQQPQQGYNYQHQQQPSYGYQQQPHATNQQQPRQHVSYNQQPNNMFQQHNSMVNNNGTEVNSVASTSKYNNRPTKEPTIPEAPVFQPPAAQVKLSPALGSEFKPLELPGLTYTEVVEMENYKYDIKGGVVLGDINSNIVTMTGEEIDGVVVDSTDSNGANLKKYLLYTAHESGHTALAVDAVSRTDYLVAKEDIGVLQEILKDSNSLNELSERLNEVVVERTTERAVSAIDKQITDHINHIINNVVKGGFTLGSFMDDWREVPSYLTTLDKVTVYTLEANLEPVMEQLRHITVDCDKDENFEGTTVSMERYDRPITGLYLTSMVVNDTLDNLADDEVRMINSDVSQILYNLLEHMRKSPVNFSKTKICYAFTESDAYIISYNSLTKYYTVVRRRH